PPRRGRAARRPPSVRRRVAPMVRVLHAERPRVTLDTLRIALAQMRHGDSLEENFTWARDFLATAAEGGARLVVLPEYWFAHGPPGGPDEGPAIRAFLAKTSRALRLTLAANVLELRDARLVNTGVVYDEGALALEQRKIHPMPREAAAGVVGGERLRVG